jgi:hypothetical protein
VGSVDRIADDSTVNQLISRYAKLFKGDICVICTHIDKGVVGDEGNLIETFEEDLEEHLEGHEHLVAPLPEIRKDIMRLTQRITNAAPGSGKNTNKPNTRTLATQQANKVELADLKKQRREMRSKFFADLILTRNTSITQKLRKNLKSSMPKGQELVVHCVSSLHYAALKGKDLYGPRLSPEATGIPKLRAAALSLAAPRLQTTLEHYMNYEVSSNLKSFQAWLNGTAVDCRSDLLDLARQPQDDLEFLVGQRLTDLDSERDSMQEILDDSIPKAKAAASKHISNKRKNRKSATIMAFVRKNGKHSTKMCPKECWNEGFLNEFVKAVRHSQDLLNEARLRLNDKFRKAIIERLEFLINTVEGQLGLSPEDFFLY